MVPTPKEFREIRTRRKDGIYEYKLFIDGKWRKAKGGETFPITNPANGKIIAYVPKASVEDANHAIESAYRARDAIGEMAAVDRAAILERVGALMYYYQDLFTELITRDAGKPISVSKGELAATAERYKYAAEEAKQITGESLLGDTVPWHKEKIGMVIRQPLGVVLALSPFNYPLFIASAKIAPALAAGNSVVCKPASDDPLCLFYLAKVLQEAGIPDGVFNLVTGRGNEIGDSLIKSNKVSMISFTGSSEVGKAISKKAGMKKLHMELGGKSPGIVLADADLDNAAKQCVTGALKFSGQRCDAISRILVEVQVADEFLGKVIAEVKKWKMGDPMKEDTKIGPLINEKAVEKVDRLVKDAVKKGATLIQGGRRLNGLYYEPTILDKVTPDMKIAWEETFGPVVTIMRVKDYEDAIKVSNESSYGLDASVFTENINKAIDAGLRLEDGTVNINAAPAHGVGNFPFGGDKDSGMDREGIKFSVEDMTRIHTIIFNPKKVG